MDFPFVQVSQTGGSTSDNHALTTPLPPFDGDLDAALQLAETLEKIIDACPIAVGLAAPQIGVRNRVAVVKIDDQAIYLIDPVVISTSGKKDLKRESCLSVWGLQGEVERRKNVLIRHIDQDGNTIETQFRSFTARAVQHEIDHLEGRLYTDLSLSTPTHTPLFDSYEPIVHL